jgi:hypothetical protein
MEWGWYARAGSVEVSEFRLFSVVFPARCSPALQDFTLGSTLSASSL